MTILSKFLSKLATWNGTHTQLEQFVKKNIAKWISKIEYVLVLTSDRDYDMIWQVQGPLSL